MSSAVFFQIQSLLIMVLMGYGISQAKKRDRHVKIMSTAIIWDIILVLQIEFTRSAIIKASKIMTNPTMLKIHLFFAISSVLLYFVMIYTGRRVLRGQVELRKKHKKIGWLTFTFRILTFVTSFYAVQK